MKKWLIKTRAGEILGPYLFRDIQYHLLKKDIFPQDEASLPCELWQPLRSFPEFRSTIRKLVPHEKDDKTYAVSHGKIKTEETLEYIPHVKLSLLKRLSVRDFFLIALCVSFIGYAVFIFYPLKKNGGESTKFQVQLEQASQFQKTGSYSQALSLYEDVFRENKDNLEAIKGVLSSTYFLRSFDSLKEKVQKILLQKDQEAHEWAYIYLSLSYMVNQDYGDAISILQKARELNGKHEAVLYNLACSYFLNGEFAQAKLYLETYFLTSKELEPHLLLGQAYLNLGDTSKALEEFQFVLNLNSQLQETYYFLAKTYQKRGEVEKTFQVFEKMFEVDPYYFQKKIEHPYFFPVRVSYYQKMSLYNAILAQRGKGHLVSESRMGLLQYLNGEKKEGLEKVQNVLLTNQKDVLTYIILGILNFYEGDREFALLNLRTALKLKPTSFLALLYSGYLTLENGVLDQAEDYFQKILEENSKSPAALSGLGRVFYKKGDHKTSEYYWKRALEFDPFYLPALEGLQNL
ncbi:MAG: tetratricopeptide repeat protein [Deltaproteobacteria bacterium]|nr:tetratricopeptide repeat protein [Deltaproteobacteria bacterium]